jgi:hypothetical protein
MLVMTADWRVPLLDMMFEKRRQFTRIRPCIGDRNKSSLGPLVYYIPMGVDDLYSRNMK